MEKTRFESWKDYQHLQRQRLFVRCAYISFKFEVGTLFHVCIYFLFLSYFFFWGGGGCGGMGL